MNEMQIAPKQGCDLPPNWQIVEEELKKVVLSDGFLQHLHLLLLQHHITKRLLDHFLPELNLVA
jgi:hypothetical protein